MRPPPVFTADIKSLRHSKVLHTVTTGHREVILDSPQSAINTCYMSNSISNSMSNAMSNSMPNGIPRGTPDSQGPKANQACLSCKKQKRRCTKDLPACQLCDRMNRHCDYSDAVATPTHEDITSLRLKVAELESRFMGAPSPYPATPSSSMSSIEALSTGVPAYNQPQEPPNQWIPNKFPAIAFLDKDAFTTGGINIPKPHVPIPTDVLNLLGDVRSVQEVLSAYFSTFHQWMPIFSQKRLSRNMVNPSWEAGPDLALLFVCMKLIASKPPFSMDGTDAQTHIYTSVKRFSISLEAAGMVTLLMLQANILITWYEYGQAIYPAAWMTSGWCVRYANLLGINGNNNALLLLGRPGTWVELEERKRTWWGVQITDRVVSLGAQGYIENSQEPKEGVDLPVDDASWENGEMSLAVHAHLSSSFDTPVGPFPRLCQASMILGKILAHNYHDKNFAEPEKFDAATQLYLEASTFAKTINDEFEASNDRVSLAAPLALAYTALCTLCDPYSCPEGLAERNPSAGAEKMMKQAIDGLITVSTSIHRFTTLLEDLSKQQDIIDRISPIIMGALYASAANFAWLVREQGDLSYQLALDDLRAALRSYSQRWRNAAEYNRLLDGQEFSYAVSGVTA
ncbi:hypothetical protein G7Y89_g11217 [Cudoniella acicularis]|uniref:Zn(2)-C6 fungal-type domain-containing protein n=1 Tax=Cudoniella acicularis TaxID=354080 RepID=A0A8H4VYH1_9HELO|nr:hypothetical protein G7Y89_g11217 [Cudoniella acicularis]